MKKTDLVRIVDKRCRRLQRDQRLLGEDVEANHNFRVEIKKLRALLRLLRQDKEQTSALYLPKPFQHLYGSVGEIRSLQLQKNLVNLACTDLAIPLPASYLAMLDRFEKHAARLVKEKAKLVSATKLGEQLVTALPQEWSSKHAEEFVLRRKAQFAAYIAAAVLTDDTLHDIRKLLKDLLYVWPYIESVMAEIFPPQFFSKETCLRLTERLGSFQDYCVALSLFRPALLAGFSQEEQQRIGQIREACSRKKAAEKKALTDSFLQLKNEIKTNMRVQVTIPVSAGQQVGLQK